MAVPADGIHLSQQAEGMAGRIEHDDHPIRLRLVLGDASVERHRLRNHFTELLASLLHRAYGRKA